MSEAKLLVVEDSKTQRAFYASVFEGHYATRFATQGKEALALVEEDTPDVILLDVEMPEMDGYEVCRRLREEGLDMPILFISAHVELQERLQGYDAGGNDFLCKPIDPRELLLKVDLVLRQRDEQLRLQENGRSAFSAAMTAMSAMSEMGVLVDFIRNINKLDSYQEITQSIGNALEAYGLHGCMQVYGSQGEHLHATDGQATPLEASIIANARTLTHIYSSGSNTSFNYPHCCLVVRDMPLDDEDRCGRLRDHLAILAEVAASRAQGLDELHREVSALQARIQAQQDSLVELRRQLPAASASLGLSPEQQTAVGRLFDQLMLGMQKS